MEYLTGLTSRKETKYIRLHHGHENRHSPWTITALLFADFPQRSSVESSALLLKA